MYLRPFSRSGFIDNLKNCNGVICNAGFELASEALHAGKKMLVKPLAGQLEQPSNAQAMRKLGLGDVMERLDATQPDLAHEICSTPSTLSRCCAADRGLGRARRMEGHGAACRPGLVRSKQPHESMQLPLGKSVLNRLRKLLIICLRAVCTGTLSCSMPR